MTEQLYLLRISAMNTCDECDIIPSAEIIVDRDFAAGGTPLLETLRSLVRQISEAIDGAPVTNVRPMTRDEIQVYRDNDLDPKTDVQIF